MLAPAIIGGVLLGLVLTSEPGSASKGLWPDAAGLEDLEAVMGAAQLPDDWQIFLAAVAYGESKWHTDVGLGPNSHPGRPPWLRPSKASAKAQDAEAKAACKAYDRNADRFANSPYPRARYCFGSGGWFGLLPANAIVSGFKAAPAMLAQIDPWDITDPIVSLVMALGYARGLMNWDKFHAGGGTWLAMRVGWGNPSAMAKAPYNTKVAKKLAAALSQLGVDPSFMYRQPSSLDGFPRGADLLLYLEGREADAQAAIMEAA